MRKQGICCVLLLTIFFCFSASYLHAEEEKNDFLPIKKIQKIDRSGVFKEVDFTLISSEELSDVYGLETMFTDIQKDTIYLNYITEDREVMFKAVDISTGKIKWHTSFGSKSPIRQQVYSVEENGEIFYTAEADGNAYLYTIDTDTGKVTRKMTQKLPSKETFSRWEYWSLKNDIVLMSFSEKGSSTLQYFDKKGELIKKVKVPGNVMQTYKGSLFASVSSSPGSITLKILDSNYKTRHSYTYKNESFWNMYFLNDGSYVVETTGQVNGQKLFKLRKYNNKGDFQWQHSLDAFTPYKVVKDKVVALIPEWSKVSMIDNGKEVKKLIASGYSTPFNVNDYIYFGNHKLNSVRIAKTDTMNWLMDIILKDGSDSLIIGNDDSKVVVFNQDKRLLSIININ